MYLFILIIIMQKHIKYLLIALLCITIMLVFIGLQTFITVNFCNDDFYDLSRFIKYEINPTAMCYQSMAILLVYIGCAVFWLFTSLVYIYLKHNPYDTIQEV